MKKVELHIQILVGLLLGLLFAIFSIYLDWPVTITLHYIKPFGKLFLNSLNMISVPLVFASLVVSIANIQDITRFSRIGGKTFSLYTVTTLISAMLGLGIAHVIQPGCVLSEQTRNALVHLYADQAEHHNITLHNLHASGPLQFLVDLIPSNLFQALSNNSHLLQVVVVAIIFGIALLKVPISKSQTVISFFSGLNDAIIELVRYIMKFAPVGVFSLVASLLVEVSTHHNAHDVVEILYALVWYVATVLLGLAIMLFIIYPLIMRIFTKDSYFAFLKAIRPAQLVAFTTSSSSAALSVTMQQVEKKIGISEEISNFVLPLGATVNMNGTAVYQSVAIVFIAQALGLNLSFDTQLMIIGNVAALFDRGSRCTRRGYGDDNDDFACHWCT